VIDVLVVGGGPAGLAAALHAAACGMEAVVLEPRTAPVDKACGEGVMPSGMRALAALGVDAPEGRPLRGIRYVCGDRSVLAEFTGGAGRGIRRTTLHAALATCVERAGIKTLDLRAGPVAQDGDSVTAAGLRARWLVAADGLHSPVRRGLGLDAPVRGPRRYGQRRHYRVPPWSDAVEVHWSPGCEAYLTPVAADLVGVAVLSSIRAPYAEHLAAFPELRDRLAHADAGPVRGAGPLRQRAARRVAGRVLLVGDAAGYVDALTGEGVALGLTTARAAVECLRAGRPGAYEARWRALTRRHRLLTHALVRGTAHAAPRRLIVPAAAAAPAVFSAVVHALQ
jgi:flavin-dependent dehydrogenase